MPVGPATGAGCAIDQPFVVSLALTILSARRVTVLPLFNTALCPPWGRGGGGRFAYSYFIRLTAEIKWLLVNI